MNLSDITVSYIPEQSPDPRPGAYYCTVLDNSRVGFLAGPFATHQEALDTVPAAKAAAESVNNRAFWYAYGTVRLDNPIGPGVLNDILGIT